MRRNLPVGLCPSCACELAADAHFCVQCGSDIDGPAGMFVAASGSPELAIQVATPPPAISSTPAPPYAAFVSQVLGLALSLSIVTFNAADNLAHSYWKVWPFAVIPSLVAVGFMLRMPGTWRRIETSENVAHQRKLLKLSIIFVVLFIATAGFVGTAIGQSGKETGQMFADFREMSHIGARISQARSTVEKTVPAQIAMYKAIEEDVESLDAVLRRVQGELTVYEDKFPDQHDQTMKSIQSVEIGLKRASLLKQQISVARDIEYFEPALRWRAWQERMEPLLDSEIALDKD